MVRRIIHIDEETCIGCGLCAEACHEGAIGIVDGKARLLRDDYCDGLGDCLPACPAGAISFIEREAAAYDEEAVKARQGKKEPEETPSRAVSQLAQWPCQLKLIPVKAPYFADAELLVAADCTAYAYAGFHEDFMRGRVTVIGCPKLDAVDYSGKLTDILRCNDIQSVTVLRMEVPCCGGLELAVKRAIQGSGKDIPIRVVTLSTDGNILPR